MNSPLKDRLLRMRWSILHFNRRQVIRRLYKIMRPASPRYISGDGFRRLASHVYDETNRDLSPSSVRQDDVVFVSTDLARAFFKKIDPGITAGYRLITHNSDLPADETLVALASEKVQVWFAQNNSFRHPNVVPLPIGLENLHHYRAGISQEYDELRAYTGQRKDRILFGFSMTHPIERAAAHENAMKAPCAESLPGRLDQGEYMRILRTYKFVLSPPGNGLDAHRTWEAMYLGVVPIVKDSVAMQAFEDLGLPLWRMRNWEELLVLTEEQLREKFEALQPLFEAPALHMNYWKSIIQRPLSAAGTAKSGSSLGQMDPRRSN